MLFGTIIPTPRPNSATLTCILADGFPSFDLEILVKVLLQTSISLKLLRQLLSNFAYACGTITKGPS